MDKPRTPKAGKKVMARTNSPTASPVSSHPSSPHSSTSSFLARSKSGTVADNKTDKTKTARKKTAETPAKKTTKTPQTVPSTRATNAPKQDVSREWPIFCEKLALALLALPERYVLILTLKNSNHFVQFLAQGVYGLRIETNSNAFLPADKQLDEIRKIRLIELGWLPPAEPSEQGALEPDGSPHYHIDFDAPIDADSVARFVMQTLIDVLKVTRPYSSLSYESFDEAGTSVILLGLGLSQTPKQENPEEGATNPAQQDLRSAVREITGIPALDYDQDGDLVVRYGELPIIITHHESAGTVSFFSPLVEDLEESTSLVSKINTVNISLGPLHLFLHENTLCARSVLPADPIVTSHLSKMLREFGEIIEAQQAAFSHEFSGESFEKNEGGSRFTH